LAGPPPSDPRWQSYGQGQGEPGWPSYGQPAEDGNARVYAEPPAQYGDPAATRGQPGNGYPPPGGEPAYGDQYGDQGAYGEHADPAAPQAQAQRPRRESGATGFVSSLFDFDFTSFVTPKIIKILYILIVVSTGLAGLAWTLIDFRISVAFGLITLIVIAPLIFFVTIGIYRVILEFFAVVFRLAEDIRAIRERGDRLG